MNANTSQKLEALASDDGPVNVYIWDMDETLILLRSLLNGTYAESFNGSKDVKRGVEIGEMWEKHILKICDNCFFYEQVSFFFFFFSRKLIQNQTLKHQYLWFFLVCRLRIVMSRLLIP